MLIFSNSYSLNPFVTNTPFLYNLKTSENRIVVDTDGATSFTKLDLFVCLKGGSYSVNIRPELNSYLPVLLYKLALNPQLRAGLIFLEAIKTSNFDQLDMASMIKIFVR